MKHCLSGVPASRSRKDRGGAAPDEGTPESLAAAALCTCVGFCFFLEAEEVGEFFRLDAFIRGLAGVATTAAAATAAVAVAAAVESRPLCACSGALAAAGTVLSARAATACGCLHAH